MDWIIGLLLLAVGVIIGFFINKYFADKKLAEQASKLNEGTLKEVMAQNAADHLSQSREIVDALRAKCEDLAEQFDSYENVLNASQIQVDGESLSFFGEHATVFIRHQQDKQKRKKETPEFQPRDFSSGGSGLFSDAKNKQVVDENN